jgi:hypothetical protein
MKKLVLAACAALAACASEPVPYHSGTEIPRGPGLFSGHPGEFVLKMGGSTSPSAAPRDADEEREYQEWRDSKRRQGKQPAPSAPQ